MGDVNNFHMVVKESKERGMGEERKEKEDEKRERRKIDCCYSRLLRFLISLAEFCDLNTKKKNKEINF